MATALCPGQLVTVPLFKSRKAAQTQKASLSTSTAPKAALRLRRREWTRTFAVALDAPVSAAASKEEEGEEEEEKTLTDFAPSAFEIQNLLIELCDETQIAEVSLKVGKFKLYVKRDVAPPPVYAAAAPPPVYYAAPEAAAPAAAAPAAPEVSENSPPADEGVVYVKAPKVGVFRRGRSYKGKQGKPVSAEGAEVKEGQIVCYLEQLSTQISIESPNAGEIVEFLIDDGEPVGYDEPLLAIRPSFPGIKKLN